MAASHGRPFQGLGQPGSAPVGPVRFVGREPSLSSPCRSGLPQRAQSGHVPAIRCRPTPLAARRVDPFRPQAEPSRRFRLVCPRRMRILGALLRDWAVVIADGEEPSVVAPEVRGLLGPAALVAHPRELDPQSVKVGPLAGCSTWDARQSAHTKCPISAHLSLLVRNLKGPRPSVSAGQRAFLRSGGRI